MVSRNHCRKDSLCQVNPADGRNADGRVTLREFVPLTICAALEVPLPPILN
jgi:hypothetical protein